MNIVLKKIDAGGRSTRYSRIKKFREKGVLEDIDGELSVNYFSPYTWRLLYEDLDSEYVVLRAINASGGVLTGMRVVGLIAPNPYSDTPIYEVYVPGEKADVFAAIVGLRDDIIVYSSSRSLFRAPPKTIVLVYSLDGSVESERVEISYGFSINEATIEQALVDIIRNDYWYYRGIAFEVYYYAKKYIDPEKTLEIAKRVGVEKRLFTIDYVVSETLGIKQLFSIPGNMELDAPINLVEIVSRLGDVLD